MDYELSEKFETICWDATRTCVDTFSFYIYCACCHLVGKRGCVK